MSEWGERERVRRKEGKREKFIEREREREGGNQNDDTRNADTRAHSRSRPL